MNRQKLIFMIAGRFAKGILLLIIAICFVLATSFFPEYSGILLTAVIVVILLVVSSAIYKAIRSAGLAMKALSGKVKVEDIEKVAGKSFFKTASEVFGVDVRDSIRNAVQQKDIPNGIPAVATVIRAQQGNTKMSMGVQEFFQVIIEVSVTAQNGEAWQAGLKQMVPITQISTFQPGVRFAIKYDPDDKMNICIDPIAEAVVPKPPKDIILQIQAGNALLSELKETGIPTTAKIISIHKLFENYINGNDVYKANIEVNGSEKFKTAIIFLIAKSSVYKIEPGKSIDVLYDRNNPQRVCLSDSGTLNSTTNYWKH